MAGRMTVRLSRWVLLAFTRCFPAIIRPALWSKRKEKKMPVKFPGRAKLETVMAIPRDAMRIAIAALSVAILALMVAIFNGR
jgi:hypothetical protein